MAGPNGAGKTTASRRLLADTLSLMTFVNADVIAQGLSGFDPEAAAFEASRVMLERLRQLARSEESFAFETTLAARTYAPWLRQLQSAGYRVKLFYCWLNDPELAVQRVALRVSRGGHSIPADVIRQRYGRSWRNFHELYRPLADEWSVYDNSLDREYQPVATGTRDEPPTVHDPSVWAHFIQGAG